MTKGCRNGVVFERGRRGCISGAGYGWTGQEITGGYVEFSRGAWRESSVDWYGFQTIYAHRFQRAVDHHLEGSSVPITDSEGAIVLGLHGMSDTIATTKHVGTGLQPWVTVSLTR